MNYKLFILIFAIVFISACSQQDYTIEDNTVIMDDENLYLSVSPATISGSGWVETEFTSKQYSGNIDFVFGFNRTDAMPTQAEIYNPHNVTTEMNFTCPVGANYTYTLNPNHLYCYKTIYEEEYEQTLRRNYNQTLFNRSFDRGNLQARTVYWNVTNTVYWSKWNPDGSVNREFAGMNKWYYSTDKPVVAGQTYKLRFYLNLPWGSSGKYSLALKPSSETIDQAITNEHFYMLDPWWNSTYTKCIDINITGTFTANTLHNIKINSTIINYADIQPDGDDIRFVNGTCDNGNTELPYYIEHMYNATYDNQAVNESWFWVQSLDTTNTIAMYYSNPTAVDNSNYSIMTDGASDYMVLDFTSYDTSPGELVGQFGLWAGDTGVLEVVRADACFDQITELYDNSKCLKTIFQNTAGSKGGNLPLPAQRGLMYLTYYTFNNVSCTDTTKAQSTVKLMDVGSTNILGYMFEDTWTGYDPPNGWQINNQSEPKYIVVQPCDTNTWHKVRIYVNYSDGTGANTPLDVYSDNNYVHADGGQWVNDVDRFDILVEGTGAINGNNYFDNIVLLKQYYYLNYTYSTLETGGIDITLNLQPTIVTSTSQISCNGTANNTFDGTDVNVTITSYKNGVLNGTESFNDQVSPYTFASSNTLFPLNYTVGDVWNCTVDAVDSNDTSVNGITSSVVTVQNSAPSFTHGDINITMNYKDTNTIQFNCTDVDTPDLNYSITNLTTDFVTPLTINLTTGIVNITGLVLADVGVHNFNVTCNDSTALASVLLNTTITNNIPTIPTYMYPANNTFSTASSITLNCSNATDPEGETLNYEFWGNVTGTSHVLWANSTSTVYNLSLTQNATYEWKCRANDNISTSNFTDNRTITKIKSINVGNSCPSGETASFFFDFADEINLTALTTDRIDYVLHYGYLGNATVLDVYGTLLSSSNLSICINSSNQYYYVDYGEIKYSKTDYTDRSFYIFQNTRLTNSTINNTLYSLLAGQATSFLFEFRDTSLNPYTEKYVALLRWYPNLNSYKVVEMGKTDDKGQTIMRVKSEDVDYRVAIYELDGTLIKLLNPVRFACIESPCTYVAVIQDTTEDYSTFDNIQSSLTYDNNTGIWTFTWNDPSQSTQMMTLNVTSERADSRTTICTSNGTGFTGVITCDTHLYSGTLRGIAYRTASPLRAIAELFINTASTVFKSTVGLFISLIIFITIVLIGVVSPIIAIILGIVALVPAYLFGSISLLILTALAVIGFIVIHFMKRSA
jgi:hypothetical protein